MQDVINLYYFYSPDKSFQLQNIKDERVKIINDFTEYVGLFSNPMIDVIVFYSLPYPCYYLFDYIDSGKYVIWWAWGYDIYYKQGNYPPLIKMDEMLKPLTNEYVKHHVASYKKRYLDKVKPLFRILQDLIRPQIRNIKKYPDPQKTQDEILSRIDSFLSPLHIEYEQMISTYSSFKANWNPWVNKQVDFPFICHNEPGNILINHSLTYTDNHIDVFNYLKDLHVNQDRKFILPVNYGINGYDGNPELLKNLSPLNPSQTVWLTKRLPVDEYQNIIESSSHAVFGMLRQQALGNVLRCLKSGVKIYLFRDSIVYKEIKKMGYVCFTIEDDLTTESLSICLNEKECRHNYNIIMENQRKTQRNIELI